MTEIPKGVPAQEFDFESREFQRIDNQAQKNVKTIREGSGNVQVEGGSSQTQISRPKKDLRHLGPTGQRIADVGPNEVSEEIERHKRLELTEDDRFIGAANARRMLEKLENNSKPQDT